MEIKCQLDAIDDFIADHIACSTCFGHHYAHHQELESIIQVVAACRIWCLVFKLSVWFGAEGCVSSLRAAAAPADWQMNFPKPFSSPVQVISGILYCLCHSMSYAKPRIVCWWGAWWGFRDRIDENRNLYYGLWTPACRAVLESGLSVRLVTLAAK